MFVFWLHPLKRVQSDPIFINFAAMALIKACRGFEPHIGPDCFLAANATIVGDVQMGEQCSVCF